LDHPGIIKIFDFYFQEDPLCIAMEFVDGTTLSDLIAHNQDCDTTFILAVFIAVNEPGAGNRQNSRQPKRQLKSAKYLSRITKLTAVMTPSLRTRQIKEIENALPGCTLRLTRTAVPI
jgi:serine/threonine protein kinase